MNYLISIITPMYNSSRYITDTIKSVLEQDYENWELIIVDDCSVDNSYEIVQEFAQKDPRIVLIMQKYNQGTAAARNKALSIAKGRFIAFLDSDDLWKPNKLKLQIDFMKSKNIAFSYSAYEKINDRGENLNKLIKVPNKINYKRLLKSNVIGCLTVIIDRNIAGDFKMPKVRYEDYATWLEIIKREKYAYGINESLAIYRVSDNSYSSNKIKALKWTWNIYRKNQKFNRVKSCYYMANFIFLTILKYLRITNLFYKN
jgi:teichuronic acid biosynthesis glycosyltransferase TuaG